jgi:hypothetical protein
VTFTLKRGGTAVSAPTNLTFPAGAGDNSSLNISPAATTDGSGQFSVSLEPAAHGARTVTAHVNNDSATPASVNVNVAPGAYSLELTSATPALPLTQGVETTAIFTVKQGGIAVDSGVTLDFMANSHFDNLPSARTTIAGGQFTVSGLTARDNGPQSIQGTVEGETVTASFTRSLRARTRWIWRPRPWSRARRPR